MSIFAIIAALAVSANAPVFAEKKCEDDRIAKIARCGTVSVPENRGDPEKRTISLNVIVMPATSPEPHLPPVFDIEGGPGLPATKNVEFYGSAGSNYRVRRDIVLVDQRGTGKSNPLHCPELPNPDKAYEPLYPALEVARCRQSLEANADLKLYGTRDAVADLDDVRAALGYSKIDLFGLSYGTSVALRYLDTYPRRVRAAVLMGVAPPVAMPPKSHAVAGERAIRMLFEDCRIDEACNAAFDPATDVKRIQDRIDKIAGAPSSDIFFEKIRSLMYGAAGARRVPYILSRAAAGDFEPFYEATRPQGPNLYADGMFLSVICAESMALMDVPAATRSAKTTIFGDYRIRRQAEACKEWPLAQVSESHLRPVVSNAAVLLVSGELDPVTPPDWADDVAKTLPRSRHVVITGSGHILDGMSGVESCFDPLVSQFLDTADVEAIDASCVQEMRPPPFVTTRETKNAG
jgi:pimeloyl-ACP methyl ester carboxylesterase